MKFPIATLAFSILTVTLHAQQAIENPVPKEKWDIKFYEAKYPIKLTAVKILEGCRGNFLKDFRPRRHFQLTFEYTDDDVKQTVKMYDPKAGESPLVGELYFFDAENVVVGRGGFSLIDSPLTGKKGDAFHFIINVVPMDDRIERAVRAQVREK